MKPNLNDYKIAYMKGKYIVFTPYDLMLMPILRQARDEVDTKKEAIEQMHRVYEDDLKEFMRLKEMGRSFPDND